MIKKAVLLFVLMGLSAALVGCQTVAGIGRDISTAGELITEAAGENP
jgi:predicted small secreted protein